MTLSWYKVENSFSLTFILLPPKDPRIKIVECIVNREVLVGKMRNDRAPQVDYIKFHTYCIFRDFQWFRGE